MSGADAILERLEDLSARLDTVQRSITRVEQSQELIRQHMRIMSQRVGALECEALTPIPGAYDHGDRHAR